jgi:Trk-type K+ transport system membrane component
MHWPSTSFSVLIILLISAATDILGPFLGAIVASAPTGTPLALYLSTANSNNAQSQQLSLTTATEGLVVGSFCTLLFAIATNQAAKSGLSLFPTLLSGYLVWFITYSIVKRVSSSS